MTGMPIRHTRRLVAFSLKGETQMPKLPPPAPPVPVEAPRFEVNAQLAETGADAYEQCSFCHGPEGISGGIAPDLRASPIVLSDKAFAEVVREGARRPRGMPSYETLSDQHLLALRHYILEQADLGRPQAEPQGVE
jgi:quinohemoprotein ethanol dehydrogenase